MAQDDVIVLLRKDIILLKALGIPVLKTFLYGSYARNEATENSVYAFFVMAF